jgi:cation transport ATPase
MTMQDKPMPDVWARRTMAIISGGLTAIAFLLEVVVSAAHQDLPGESPELAAMPLLVPALFGVAIICGLWFAIPESRNAIRRKRPSLTLLMTIVVVSAVVMRAWLAAAGLSFGVALYLSLRGTYAGRS